MTSPPLLRVLVCATLLAVGCSAPEVLPPEDAGVTAQPPDAGSEPDGGEVAWPTDCPRPVPASDDVLGPGSLVVFGEIHGTREVPAFVSRMACEAARWRRPVRVGVEFPVEEQARLDAFMASDGGAEARAALLDSPFWTRAADRQDGRTSEAMLGMLESMRALRPAVSVFAFDTGVPAGGTRQDRDHGMADFIRATKAAAAPDELFIIHTGNVHARIQIGVPWDAAFEPMAWSLLQDHPGLRALDVAHTGGTAWICTGQPITCDARPLSGDPSAEGDGVELFAQPGTFHGRYRVGAISASPPAVVP